MYVIKNKLYILLIFTFDIIGTIITAPFKLIKKRLRKDPKKILIIRLDHIGDLISATPVFRILKEAYPNAKLDVLASKRNIDILKNNPFIDEIMPYDAPWFNRRKKRLIKVREYFRLVNMLKKQKYDLGIDLRGDIRHIILMRLACIYYRVGYGTTGGGFLLNREINYRTGVHEVDHNLDVIREIGINITEVKPDFFTSKEQEESTKRLLSDKGLMPGDFIVSMHPGAGYPSKRWTSSKWAQLIDKLNTEFNAKVIIVGAEEEKSLLVNIRKETKIEPISAVGETSLGELAALFKNVNLFIGTDSGPSHIASAVNTPSVILYSGTNDSRQWAPLSDKNHIIQKDIPCKHCERLKCANNICMDIISVDETMDAARRIIK